MKKITVFGTITRDNIHIENKTQHSFGGIPWYAVKLSPMLKSAISIVTNVGHDFPIKRIPSQIRNNSIINSNHIKTSVIDIFPLKSGVPAKVKEFTGQLKIDKSLSGDAAIVSPLFQEISIKDISLIRKGFALLIIDLQGFTRPRFKKGISLSNLSKKQPFDGQRLCKLADLVKVSDDELNVFSGKDTKAKLGKLHQLGATKVLVTKGKKGCLYSSFGKTTLLKTRPASIENSVGAGDMLITLVTDKYINGFSWEQSIIKSQSVMLKLLERRKT